MLWLSEGRLAVDVLEPSVGSVGDPYHSTLVETINDFYKAEMIDPRGPWRRLEDVELATLT